MRGWVGAHRLWREWRQGAGRDGEERKDEGRDGPASSLESGEGERRRGGSDCATARVWREGEKSGNNEVRGDGE